MNEVSSNSDNSSKSRKHLFVKKILLSLALAVVLAAIAMPIYAATVNIDMNTDGAQGGLGSLQLLFVFVLLAIAPSLLMMMTGFTRIVIVLSFLRNAIGLQQTPPNQVIVGLSLALSLFIMAPVISEINETAVQPLINQEITQEQALTTMQVPIKIFMLKQTQAKDLNLFLSISGDNATIEKVDPQTLTNLSLGVVVPAFITSELKLAFTIGFLLFLPFMIIDMIVSSTLMSMGMVMLPPSMISLPFKLMLFVVVDGWSLIMDMLVRGFK